jgi:hypothetical protein
MPSVPTLLLVIRGVVAAQAQHSLQSYRAVARAKHTRRKATAKARREVTLSLVQLPDIVLDAAYQRQENMRFDMFKMTRRRTGYQRGSSMKWARS